MAVPFTSVSGRKTPQNESSMVSLSYYMIKNRFLNTCRSVSVLILFGVFLVKKIFFDKYLQLCSHLLVGFLGWAPVLWALGSVEETLGPRPLQDSILCCLTLLESRAVSSLLS